MKQARVCLVTTSQPSANPRVVKEADALVGAGYDVVVVAAHWQSWATEGDRELVATRAWEFRFLDWRRDTRPWIFWKSRIRHRAARAVVRLPGLGRFALDAAAGRVTPELTALAKEIRADLYVAHNIGALPAAAAAARRHGARLGFDAEDFHRGQYRRGDDAGGHAATMMVEAQLLPRCDYVTAASPDIAASYASANPGVRPVPVLNVFPMADRPAVFRPTAANGPLRLYWFSQTIGPHRGLEDIVGAMGRVTDGAVELHLQGRWDESYARTLRDVAVASRVPWSRVVSHPPAPSDTLVRQAADYDVGLALEPGTTPNSNFALSNKLFTYLLAGAAIAASRTKAQGALAEVVPEACGTYRPGDVDALAGILAKWVADREALDAARRAAWLAGSTRFNWDREKEVYLRVIERVLGRQARPSGDLEVADESRRAS